MNLEKMTDWLIELKKEPAHSSSPSLPAKVHVFNYNGDANNLDLAEDFYNSLEKNLTENLKVPEEDFLGMRNCIDEAVKNAQIHSTNYDPNKKIGMDAFATYEGVYISIISDGNEFNKEKLKSNFEKIESGKHLTQIEKLKMGGGMGLYLIKRISSSAGIITDKEHTETTFYISFENNKRNLERKLNEVA